MRASTVCSLFTTSIAALAAAMLLAAGPASASPAAPTPELSDCVLQPRRTVLPDLLLQGESATITLALGGYCPPTVSTMHMVMVLDGSASVSRESSRRMNEGAKGLMHDLMQAYDDDIRRFGVVSFNSTSRTCSTLTDDLVKLDGCLARVHPDGGSAVERGLMTGLTVFRKGYAFRTRRSNPNEVMVIFTNGHFDRGCAPGRRMVQRVKDAGVLVIAVSIDETADAQCVRDLASSARYYFELNNIGDLLPIFDRLSDMESLGAIQLRQLALVDTLAPGVNLIPGSASPPATLAEDRRSLRWSFAPWRVRVPGITVTYRVRALRPGRLAIGSQARADFVDLLDYPGFLDLPPAWLTVLAPDHRP